MKYAYMIRSLVYLMFLTGIIYVLIRRAIARRLYGDDEDNEEEFDEFPGEKQQSDKK